MSRPLLPNRVVGDVRKWGVDIRGDAPPTNGLPPGDIGPRDAPPTEGLPPDDIAPGLSDVVAIRRRIAATILQRCTIRRYSGTLMSFTGLLRPRMETHLQPSQFLQSFVTFTQP